MKLSSLKLHDIGVMKKNLLVFMVIDLHPEGSQSGWSSILYKESDECEICIWQESDPEVVFVGKGDVYTTRDWFKE